MSLLRAELRRLRKRRLAAWMLLLVLVLMGTVVVVSAVSHYKPGPAAQARAEAQAAEEYRNMQRWIEDDIAECERSNAAGDPDSYWPEDCEEIRDWNPSQEEMVEWYLPPAFEFRTNFPNMISVLAALLGLFAFTVAASFVGAEWRTGGMMNLLLWRPRRLQVLLGKLGALLGVFTGLTVVLGALWTGAFWLVAVFRGITDTMTSGAWQSIGLAGLRAWVLVLLAGAIGFALASIGRHTAAAMGTAIAAFVVGVAGVAMLAGGILQVRFFEAWLWTTYVGAWMEGSVVLRDWGAPCERLDEQGSCLVPEMEVTWQVAGVGLVAVVALVLGAAMWQMRRRDVT